jgi:2-polyprenyl-3-methyl-5-hydroxy-6-metoxy-1,4-benzoquinol methylase
MEYRPTERSQLRSHDVCEMTQRIIEQEQMDHAPDREVQESLADLRRLNHWFGGESTLRYALKGYERASILDIGAASGEVARSMPNARVVSLDLQCRNLLQAPRPAVCANAFQLPFADNAFEVVTCSLFLHHFDDAQVISLLREFARVARFRVAVVDLERHTLAECFLPITRPLFRWSEMTVSDGVLSVRAAFRTEELGLLAAQAGLYDVCMKRHIPWFRLSMVATPK